MTINGDRMEKIDQVNVEYTTQKSYLPVLSCPVLSCCALPSCSIL